MKYKFMVHLWRRPKNLHWYVTPISCFGKCVTKDHSLTCNLLTCEQSRRLKLKTEIQSRGLKVSVVFSRRFLADMQFFFRTAISPGVSLGART